MITRPEGCNLAKSPVTLDLQVGVYMRVLRPKRGWFLDITICRIPAYLDKGALSLGAQRSQQLFIKEWTLNYGKGPCMIQRLFLNQGRLEALGVARETVSCQHSEDDLNHRFEVWAPNLGPYICLPHLAGVYSRALILRYDGYLMVPDTKGSWF